MNRPVQVVRVKGNCSRSQHRRLGQLFSMSAEMYNACLESWKGTYEWWKRHHNPNIEKFPAELSSSRYDLMRMFTGVRQDRPEWAAVSVNVGRGVICRFDRATASFYKRCQDGKTPGYPRFKPASRWRSLEVVDASSSMIVPPGTRGNGSSKWRLAVKGVPRIRFEDRGGRIQGAISTGAGVVELRVVRTVLRVEVHVVLRFPPCAEPEHEALSPVGVDKGLATRLTLSDGTSVAARDPDLGNIKRRQRALSRAKQGPRSRAKKRKALARAWRKESESARMADFRLADRLVTSYDAIAVEDLNVAGLLRSRLFSHKTARQRWASFDHILEHKAAKAGAHYAKVNPANTTTDRSHCGHRQRIPLGTRVYNCGDCGIVLDRDLNAARNICARAGWSWGQVGHTPDVARITNFCQETELPPTGERRRQTLQKRIA